MDAKLLMLVLMALMCLAQSAMPQPEIDMTAAFTLTEEDDRRIQEATDRIERKYKRPSLIDGRECQQCHPCLPKSGLGPKVCGSTWPIKAPCESHCNVYDSCLDQTRSPLLDYHATVSKLATTEDALMKYGTLVDLRAQALACEGVLAAFSPIKVEEEGYASAYVSSSKVPPGQQGRGVRAPQDQSECRADVYELKGGQFGWGPIQGYYPLLQPDKSVLVTDPIGTAASEQCHLTLGLTTFSPIPKRIALMYQDSLYTQGAFSSIEDTEVFSDERLTSLMAPKLVYNVPGCPAPEVPSQDVSRASLSDLEVLQLLQQTLEELGVKVPRGCGGDELLMFIGEQADAVMKNLDTVAAVLLESELSKSYIVPELRFLLESKLTHPEADKEAAKACSENPDQPVLQLMVYGNAIRDYDVQITGYYTDSDADELRMSGVIGFCGEELENYVKGPEDEQAQRDFMGCAKLLILMGSVPRDAVEVKINPGICALQDYAFAKAYSADLRAFQFQGCSKSEFIQEQLQLGLVPHCTRRAAKDPVGVYMQRPTEEAPKA